MRNSRRKGRWSRTSSTLRICARNYFQLEDICKGLFEDMNVRQIGSLTEKNICRWIEQLPPDKKYLVIEAWNEWIRSSAKHHYATMKSEIENDLLTKVIRFLAAYALCLLLIATTRLQFPYFFTRTFIFIIGFIAIATLILSARDALQTLGIISSKKADAYNMLNNIPGWQLNAAGTDFLINTHPSKYATPERCRFAPKVQIDMTRRAADRSRFTKEQPSKA